MKPVIAVPYFPGSNGDIDAIREINNYGMKAEPLYFHFNSQKRLEDNALAMSQMNGAFLCGGFPYEDRLGFGRVPAKIPQYSETLRKMADEGKPILAVCSGNQIAQTMRLAFPQGSQYKAQMLPNICDRDGQLVYHGFLDAELYTKMTCDPKRNAFTRCYEEGEVMPQVIDHGGGRFWADKETLEYLIANDMIAKRYCDEHGNVIDNFPTNPNGSMLNIESISNARGNVKIGMCHDERKTNALREDRSNLAFVSMREYIEDGCQPLRNDGRRPDIKIKMKDYSYLCPQLDASRTYDIYIRMLTDDNERNTAQLFLGKDVERRRLIRLEVAGPYADATYAANAVKIIAGMDFIDGIMLKKDVPMLAKNDIPGGVQYEVIEKSAGRVVRDFIYHGEIVPGFPAMLERVSSPNPHAYMLRKKLWENPSLRDVISNVQTGSIFFFRNEQDMQEAQSRLFD